MIADAAVLSSSVWRTDSLLTRDASFQSTEPESPVFDADYSNLGTEIVRMKTESLNISRHQTSSNRSAGTSVASSECSDELYFDYDGDNDSLFAVSEDQEYLSSSFYNILDVSSLPAPSPFDWSDTDLDPCHGTLLGEIENNNNIMIENEELLPNIHRPSPALRRKRTHSQSLTDHKPWSKMSCNEQISTIEELSKVISHHMGLREQLEVIRIINPKASVSPTDAEFVIDLDSLSDEKLNRVREYVKQHSTREDGTLSSTSSSPERSSCSETNSLQTKLQLTKKQKKLQQKEQRQRQRKEYRQMMKERKSGLFAKEEVLALATDQGEVDLDIDILT